MKKEAFKHLGREEVYQGRVITVVKDKLQLPNGKEADWDLVLHNGAAAILPIDEAGNLLLIQQFRHAAEGITLEIPAGTLEPSEDPLSCAKRELEEETGYQAENFQFLFRYYSAIGFCNEQLYIYLATGLKATKQHLDEDEFVTVTSISLEDALEKINSGEIVDGKTISAILSYALQLKK